MSKAPLPPLRGTLSREGRGKKEANSREGRGKKEALSREGRGKEDALTYPSPLAGEGAARSAAGEGSLLDFAKQLRSNMTEAERKLWGALRAKRFDGFKFKRQVPIGRYIVDFICFEKRLIIEVDGGQHSESKRDAVRDRWLVSQGFHVMRFWNVDVFQALDGTLIAILDALNQGPSPAAARHPLPQGEREGRSYLPQGEREGRSYLPRGAREGRSYLPRGEREGRSP